MTASGRNDPQPYRPHSGEAPPTNFELAVVDAGPLVAAFDRSDPEHRRSRAALAQPRMRVVVPALVVAEATYFIADRLGPDMEADFLAGFGELAVEIPHPEDWTRIADLVRQYRDFPLGGTDASVVALAERLDTDLIITLDHRHFAAIRPRHVPAFRLLPE